MKRKLFVAYGVSGPGGVGFKNAVLTMAVAGQELTSAELDSVHQWLQANGTPPGMTASVMTWRFLADEVA